MSRRKRSSSKRKARWKCQVHHRLLIDHYFLVMPWRIISSQIQIIYIRVNEPTREWYYWDRLPGRSVRVSRDSEFVHWRHRGIVQEWNARRLDFLAFLYVSFLNLMLNKLKIYIIIMTIYIQNFGKSVQNPWNLELWFHLSIQMLG
jgi:hypothetical protein